MEEVLLIGAAGGVAEAAREAGFQVRTESDAFGGSPAVVVIPLQADRGAAVQSWPGAALLRFCGVESTEAGLEALAQGEEVLFEGAPQAELEARLRGAAHRAREGQAAAMIAVMRLVAHDVNNPLAAIRILAEMLAIDLEDPQARRDAQDMLEAVDWASALLEGLGALLRLADHRALRPRPAELVGVVSQVTERPCFRDGVEVRVPGEPAWALADPEAALQALTDVLVHARCLSDEGTPLRIALEDETEAWAVRVEHQGAAPPDDLRPLLFQPFGAAALRQARVSVAPVGLAYAHWFARRTGGELRFEAAREGRWATVLRLPRASG